MTAKPPQSDLVKARLMLVALCLAWGLTWPAMKIALAGIPPFTMRSMSAFVGAAALTVLAGLARQRIAMPRARMWVHIAVVSLFNIVLFSVCTAFAQLSSATGRVAIIVYTMPVWASLLAWIVLREWLSRSTVLALALCCCGLAVLVYPLAGSGIPPGLLLALGASVSWAIGTVYLKWARTDLAPFTLAVWQLVIACVVLIVCVPLFDPPFKLSDAPIRSLLAVGFSGLFGSGLAYFLWFHIIRLLPAATASLGALASPVIGIVSSAILLGEIPTFTDVIGFTLIFAASICVLVRP